MPRWLPGLLFAASIAVLCASDALNPQFDWVAEPVSRHAYGPLGWLVPLGILLAGAGTASGLAVLHRFLRGDRSVAARGAQLFLAVAVAMLVVCAVVPADPVGYGHASWREIVHGGAGWVALLGFPFAAFALRRRLRAWWLTAVAVGASLGAAFIVVIWLRLTQTWYAFAVGRHHTVFGLDERAAMYLAFAWLGLAAWWAGGRSRDSAPGRVTPTRRPR